RRVDPFTRRLAPPAPPSVARIAPATAQPKVAAPIAPLVKQHATAPAIAPSASAPRASAPASIASPLAAIAQPSLSLHTVTVRPGDSLWKLAQQSLGRGSRWQELLAANPGIVDPTRIAAGTEIVVPAKLTTLKSD